APALLRRDALDRMPRRRGSETVPPHLSDQRRGGSLGGPDEGGSPALARSERDPGSVSDQLRNRGARDEQAGWPGAGRPEPARRDDRRRTDDDFFRGELSGGHGGPNLRPDRYGRLAARVRLATELGAKRLGHHLGLPVVAFQRRRQQRRGGPRRGCP